MKATRRELIAQAGDLAHDLPDNLGRPSATSILPRLQHLEVGQWVLTPAADNGTRLVTRIHAAYDWRHPLLALLGVILMELGDFAMLRRMLRGIKARAESLALAPEPFGAVASLHLTASESVRPSSNRRQRDDKSTQLPDAASSKRDAIA